MDKPNFLILITDQERHAPPYENEDVARFRAEHMPARRWLSENGVRFERHYTGATACSPSRPTLLTGHYPSLHAVTQTSGIAKHHGDARLRWLLPRDVPTLGDYFRAGGYETVYKGKWHVSDADLHDEQGRIVRSNDSAGRPVADGIRAYEQANLLDDVGFDGWIGPEPHGAALSDSGIRRDPIFATQVSGWLEERASRNDDRPFLLVASFVNPHDICLWPTFALQPPVPLHDENVPTIPAPPSADEDLSHKPMAQQLYRRAYLQMYGPEALMRNVYENHLAPYRRFYYHLHQLVDREIDRVLATLRSTRFFDDTVIVFTSDHGELLGAHGGLHQKWFNMYDETVRVPFSVSHSGAFGPRGKVVEDVITSHVDLVPTLIGLAGLDAAELSHELEGTHAEVQPLVGRDLSAMIRDESDGPTSSAVYFATEDRILEGDQQVAALAQAMPALRHVFATAYDAIRGCPTTIEGIVAKVGDDALPGASGHVWKLVRYFDDPDVWSNPGVEDAYRYQSGPRAGEVEHRTEPYPDEWELYDLTEDPTEQTNVADRPFHTAVFEHLRALLADERTRKRLTRTSPRPYATITPHALAERPWVDLASVPGLPSFLDWFVRAGD